MKKTFYIIRHGEKVKTPGDSPLSKLGHKQTKRAGKCLKGSFPISKIVASPILRAQQTARHIADHFDIEVDTNDLLRERVNWGDDPDQTIEEFIDMWVKSNKEREWKPPVGDSSYDAGKRMEQLIEELLEDEHDHIALITHGGIITDFLRNAFATEDLEKFIPDFESTLDDNIGACSITIVEKYSDKPNLKLVDLAHTDHLK